MTSRDKNIDTNDNYRKFPPSVGTIAEEMTFSYNKTDDNTAWQNEPSVLTAENLPNEYNDDPLNELLPDDYETKSIDDLLEEFSDHDLPEIDNSDDHMEELLEPISHSLSPAHPVMSGTVLFETVHHAASHYTGCIIRSLGITFHLLSCQ